MELEGLDKSQIGVSIGVGMSGSGEIASTWDLMVPLIHLLNLNHPSIPCRFQTPLER